MTKSKKSKISKISNVLMISRLCSLGLNVLENEDIICERNDHPWFIGVQYHPELKSKPFDPHPLFVSFIEAAIEQGRLV